MRNNKPLDARLDHVYSTQGDKRALFDQWAATYDRDLLDDLGYVADRVAAEKLMALVPDTHARILDIGCGTGLVGRRLHDAGYRYIDGNDYADEMLNQARDFGVYQQLSQHDITQPVPVKQPYDAAIAVGVFAFSVPNATHLVNVVDCVAPGGPALVTVNGKAWREKNWDRQISEFRQTRPDIVFESIETIDYLTAENIDGRLLLMRRTA